MVSRIVSLDQSHFSPSGAEMRISNTGEQRVDLAVYVKGQRVHEGRVVANTAARHPAQVVAHTVQDYKKSYMQRSEIKQAAILPEEVEVRGQMVYS
jgi:hypothetical protein